MGDGKGKVRDEARFLTEAPTGATVRFRLRPDVLVAGALTLLNEERFDEAEQALRGALADGKYNADVWIWMLVVQARRLLKAHDHAGAIEKYREILATAPSHQEALQAVAAHTRSHGADHIKGPRGK